MLEISDMSEASKVSMDWARFVSVSVGEFG